MGRTKGLTKTGRNGDKKEEIYRNSMIDRKFFATSHTNFIFIFNDKHSS